MAKVSDNNSVSNEELEAKAEEFGQKLEILRVRYEQYFIGTEKVAPSVLRMDVARIMRELENAKIRNTAVKFKVRTLIQKFTSYSTYWNRTLREIEDGTYKRHIDRAKREQAQKSASQGTRRQSPAAEGSAPKSAAAQAAADEAAAFLASLQIGTPTVSAEQKVPTASAPQAPPAAAPAAGLRSRRPLIVASKKSPEPSVTASANSPVAPTPAHAPSVAPGQGVSPSRPASAAPGQGVSPSRPAPAVPGQGVLPSRPAPAVPAQSQTPRTPPGVPVRTPPGAGLPGGGPRLPTLPPRIKK